MCGIAGLLAPEGSEPLDSMARLMADAMTHRGPDDQGIWSDAQAGVVLAHRRLSVIDVSPLGHQPMHSASGRFVVVYNGEIYNFEELRRSLEAAGRAPPWRGHSDTEVLLAAIEAWGFEGAVSRTIGMFAIALWDRERRVLALARDRLGEKPLYYGRLGATFCFASELKAVRAVRGHDLRIDRRALSRLLQLSYVPSPMSIYRGLSKLAPGHLVEIAADLSIGQPRAYWTLGDTAESGLAGRLAAMDDERLVDLLHDRLKEAVGLQMVSDVPLGAFLSGGVDSSTVVALMQAQTRRPVRTFTIGFPEASFDEAPFARAVAGHLGTDHTELYVSSADATAVIPQLPDIYDEPFADSSQIPTTLVSRLTRRHVTVSLSGDGGDELFAGYPRYEATAALWRRVSRLPTGLRTAASAALRLAAPRTWDRGFAVLPIGLRQKVNGRRVHRMAQLVAAQSLAEMYVRLMSHWQPEDQLVADAGGDDHEPSCIAADGTLVEQLRRCDVHRYLPDDLLVKVDRASMSASLESRAPLLDHRVVDLAFALPERALLRDGRGKWILRKVLDRYVPRTLIDRPKAGFAVPLADWLRGPLHAWAMHLLNGTGLAKTAGLDRGKIDLAWQQHQSGRFDRSYALWNVLMFLAWLEKNPTT
jgi:asparagine synthase (glutamine-hydrolysing)